MTIWLHKLNKLQLNLNKMEEIFLVETIMLKRRYSSTILVQHCRTDLRNQGNLIIRSHPRASIVSIFLPAQWQL